MQTGVLGELAAVVESFDPAAGPPAGVPAAVRAWVAECEHLCRPAVVVWCDGSAAERANLLGQGVRDGVFVKLNEAKRPNCYLHRSHPNDVARSEHLTFICTPTADMAGPTNNWWDPKGAYATLRDLFAGSYAGRTMYVVPFVMGPVGSPLCRVGVQVTDSLYVAVSMGLMTRMGTVAWEQLARDPDAAFTRCLHGLGDVNPDRRFVCHFPVDNAIWSFGSGYGGNALLGKKCLALRLASYMGQQQGWMAEHMLLTGVTSPAGETTYVAGAFPSACGKTNFAMLIPPPAFAEAGWRVTTVGDDIVWMWVDAAGRLRAVNPEAGYFGVVPGTNGASNPNAMACMARDAIFTNVALLPDGDVWWEGLTKDPPEAATDWQGQPWTPSLGTKAAHPNSRFTAAMTNNPALDPNADSPAGVPVSAIVFGGRRSKHVPLVYQAFNWLHGVYVGATIGSETTAAASGAVGVVRRDPMAMLPFLGYNVRDYLVHWFRMRRRLTDTPRIFHVNWFRTDADGRFLWPGFGQNMRVLKWIVDRCHGRTGARETLLGWMPRAGDIDLGDIPAVDFDAAQHIDADEVKAELLGQEELFLKLAGDLPKEMIFQRELLVSRL